METNINNLLKGENEMEKLLKGIILNLEKDIKKAIITVKVADEDMPYLAEIKLSTEKYVDGEFIPDDKKKEFVDTVCQEKFNCNFVDLNTNIIGQEIQFYEYNVNNTFYSLIKYSIFNMYKEKIEKNYNQFNTTNKYKGVIIACDFSTNNGLSVLIEDTNGNILRKNYTYGTYFEAENTFIANKQKALKKLAELRELLNDDEFVFTDYKELLNREVTFKVIKTKYNYINILDIGEPVTTTTTTTTTPTVTDTNDDETNNDDLPF